MKVAFHTLGCKVNSYESQAIAEQFLNENFEIAQFSDFCDVYIVNTCSVTAEAARKSRQMLHRCKKINPDATVIACGCFAQEAKEELLKDGAVDYVVGNNEKSRVLQLIAERKQEKILVDDLTHCTDYEDQTITNQGSHVRAYVKIQDGCNRFCSYCIIPFLRGRSRSRLPEDVLDEIKTLAENGYKEIVLTGIDISDYQKDGPKALADLIQKVNEIDGIERIRLGSLEVSLITEAFVETIAACRKICPHFHLSLQSGCQETLKAMNRHYTPEEYAKAVELLRNAFKNPAITTDIIVGFAGESEEHFEESKAFAEKIAFAESHVFPYSRRKGTRADLMKGQLSKAEKAKRVGRMMETTNRLTEEFVRAHIGQELEILVEEEKEIQGETYQIGFTKDYVKAGFRSKDKEINKIVTFIPNSAIFEEGEWILL
ncbi:MAG: tRNA (N(6)-L-threonylcarbamoyladenosine(37)-C(2))-methylthiotransferase MtaB [Lachnospiraceae bacterium]|nr:tRNA (N(6)-L-threonylcarbamoyladenosine(37)-C(2))-methylthiotransferase MtaB [Lachnospiraceae bacterium]